MSKDEARIDPVVALNRIVENLKKHIPAGAVVKICIGNNASWAECVKDEEIISFENPALRIDQNVNDAICVALGWRAPARKEETMEQKLAKLPPELRLDFLLREDDSHEALW